MLGGTPAVLVTSQDTSAVVADDQDVYWSDEVAGEVARFPIAGGARAVLARNQLLPADIAVDDHNVYWLNSVNAIGTVMKVAK